MANTTVVSTPTRDIDKALRALPISAELRASTIISRVDDELQPALMVKSARVSEAKEHHAERTRAVDEWNDAKGKAGPEWAGDQRLERQGNALTRDAERSGTLLERQRSEYAETAARYKSWSAAKSTVLNYLEHVPELDFEEASFEPMTPKKNQSPQELVMGLIEAAKEKRAEAKSILDQPIPRDEAVERAKAEVSKLAKAPSIHDLCSYRRADADISRLGGGFHWPRHPTVWEGAEDRTGKSLISGAAIVAWAAPDLILKAIMREIDARYAEIEGRGIVPLSSSERADKLAAVKSERMQLELQCADLIWRFHESGVFIPWPSGLDARAILGISGPDLRRR